MLRSRHAMEYLQEKFEQRVIERKDTHREREIEREANKGSAFCGHARRWLDEIAIAALHGRVHRAVGGRGGNEGLRVLDYPVRPPESRL